MSSDSSELGRLVDQLKRSAEGAAWHGPSVREVLRNVGAQKAAARVLPHCHTAWEILVHMTAWTRAAREALDGRPLNLTDQEDWPAVPDLAATTWEDDQSEFFQETERLIGRLEGLDDALFTKIVPGRDYDYYYLLHGIVQHNLYHAGQIRLLTK